MCMCRVFMLFGLFVLSSFLSFSQTVTEDYRKKTEEVKLESDTVWIINTEYDLYHTRLELTLDFSKLSPAPTTINWGETGANDENIVGTQMTHMFEKGLYDIRITAQGGKVYHYMVFNKALSTDFEIYPDPFKYCLEVDGDSLLIVKKNFEHNLPGTVYQIIIDPIPLIEDNVNVLYDVSEWFGPNLDSAWVEFKHQTGVKPCNVYLKLNYSDEEKNIELEEETNPQKVSVYRAPNVKKIFGFEEPKEGEAIEDMKVCTGTRQDYLNLDGERLNYYQYKKGSLAPTPYYNSYDKAKDLEIHYFYSDTLYENMPETVWKEVSGQANMVSITDEVLFFEPGYYKMMITAKNLCNEVGKIKIDTLWTDRVSWDDTKKRYFQVFSHDETKIECKNEKVCLNIPDTIVIVDYNTRRGFEPLPEYKFSAAEYDLANDAEIITNIWRNGKIIKMPEAKNAGCDSTVIYIILNKDDFYGELNLELTKADECDGMVHTFKLNVGWEPVIEKDSIYKALAETTGGYLSGIYFDHCDTFIYQLPIDTLLMEKYTRGFALDSAYFYIKQGTADEDSLIYRNGKESKLTQLFDSTDVFSYVRIRSYNGCGMVEDTLKLRVNRKPKLELWRDEVSKNDSLCIGVDYTYQWKGSLPDDYWIYLTPSNPVYVNGVLQESGQVKIENGDEIRHTVQGKSEERFLMQNKNMLSCAMDSTWEVEVLALPDTLLHPDSVGYCSGSLEINTKKLFETGKSDFKWAEWKLNEDEVKKENFPDVVLTGGVDTLRYKLSRSKGCYVESKLILRPHEMPELKLQDQVKYCLPETVTSFRSEAYVENLSDWLGYNYLTVYEDRIAAVAKRYEDTETGPEDSDYELFKGLDGKKWIYKIENTRVDTALMGKCRLLDTVTLSVSDPQLKVLKSDMLKYPWDEYDFARLEAGNFIDTAQITASTIKWTLRPEGTFWQNVLYGSPYNLTLDDKAKDTLLFELSAESYCGDELKDTLLVELNHLKVKGYKDTICSNEKEYPLWDKVKWSYVDLSSVQWNIVHPLSNKGTISGTGSDAVYTPGEGTDSVRIWFKATSQDVPTEQPEDTVVLLINPAPVLKISKDTLWACNRRIELKQISSSYIHSANTKGVVHGDYILKPGQAQVGKWSGENYTFEEVILSNFLENISQKVSYVALGLDGCKNAIDTVVLVDPVPAKVNFKRTKEEMCAGDRIKLDTLYTVTGKDQYTHLKWSIASSSSGHLENDQYYVASKPEDKIQELSLVSYKEYTCYDGNPSGQAVKTEKKTLPLTVHREPKFSVTHKYDTLCRNQLNIPIKRDWVKVEAGLYPDYHDSVRVEGLPLLDDGIPYSVNEGKHEKLVVTVAQGRCSRWNTQSDTIYLYRLPAMLSGSFTVDDVCEGGQAEIDKTNLAINPLASQIKWTATGGTISGDNKYFIPDNDIRQGFVNLTANAPHNCGTKTLPDVPVNIGRKPQLKNREYTICSLEGHLQQITTAVKDPSVVVEKIDWYRCGTTNEYIMTTGTSESEWTFTVSAADIQKTELCLLAKIKCGGACRGIFEDTVRIDWQEKPSIVVLPVNVCQGAPEGIDLNLKVQTSNAGLVAWHLQNSAAGTMEGSVYLPGEYNGTTVVNVTAPGLYGCPDEVKPVNITVDAAPKSGIVLNGENCTQRQVTFKPGSKKAQSYDWNFGDGVQVNGEVSAINHVYQNKGTYVITMESHFANSCTRKEEKTWIVNPTPQANFIVPDFAPIAKPVTFNSISLPETVTCNWTIDIVSNYPGPSASHTFSTDGSHEVQLVVTSLEGCTDTLLQTTTVLDKPVVDFELEVDSCGGVVKIINHSVRNDATVAWDFGNGQSVAEDWEPQPQSYPLVWKDTTYKIILTLSNISDTVKDSISFNMISRLEPAFELWTNTDQCNKTEKEIRILTKGKADTTYVDWGDGTQPDMWLEKDQVNVLAHSYPQNTSTSLNDYTIRFRSVNVCHHPLPVEKGVTIVPQQIRAKLMEEEELVAYKNKCYGHDRAFWNKSFGFIPQGYTCIWDFGDNTPLEADTLSYKPKTHVFEKPGTYTVRLRVKDECNEKMDMVQIVVHGNDSLDFAFEKDKSRLCTGDSIRLWLVERGEEPFTDLRWTLPDGSYQEADTIFYKFKEAGKGNVTLKATAGGCPENPLTKSCQVHQTPQPMIDAANVNIEDCTPLKIPFRATNGSGNMDNINVSWDFGDGTSSQEAFPPLKEYETAGQYMVKMKMTSAEECVAWDSVLAVAKITPDAKMELSSHLVCSPDGNFEITALNKTLSPEDYSFEWYRNTEVISMAPDVVTIPFTEFFGKEDIALRAVHKLSLCEHIVKDSIVASYPVKAGLLVLPDTVCSGMEVRFVDTTTVAGTVRQLIFEDGSVVEQQEVARTYPDAGKYAYRFAVTNPAGCTDTLRDTVYVHSLPLAEFYWDKDNSITGLKEIPESDVENGGIRFENLSEFEPLEWEKQGLQYRWDFGDGETSVEKDPGHLFANNGSYEVWLHTVSLMGCRDSVAQVIDISTVKGLFFPNAMVPASDDPGVNRFQPKGIGLQLFTVKIYAQDGTCVWQTDKLDEGRPAEYWDGTFNGQIVPAGTYTWKASAMFIDGTVKSHINGNLIVVR